MLKIHIERCKGCGICVAFCPKKVLAVNEIEKVEIVNEKDCIKCVGNAKHAALILQFLLKNNKGVKPYV